MAKTIRFGDLVRDSGRPQTVALWGKPENDPILSRAIKQNRVLTVVQELGKSDHGTIGFKQLPGAVYLVFPKPLPNEPDARVIGLNYQLIEEPVVPAAQRAKSTEPKPPKPIKLQPEPELPPRQPRPAAPLRLPPPPSPRKFTVRIRRTATQETDFTVEALDQTSAERQALERARQKPFKPAKDDVQVQLVKTEQA
jgi:hypothetical protein